MATKKVKQIESDNLDAHILVVKSEIDQANVKLVGLITQIKIKEADVAQAESDKASFLKEKEEFYTDKATKLKEFSDKERLHNEEVIRLTTQVVALKDEIKQSTKELARINSSCLTGIEDSEKIQKTIVQLNIQVEELTNLVVNYEEIKKRVRTLEIEEERVKNAIKDAKDASEIKLTEARAQLSNLSVEKDLAIAERNAARIEAKRYSDDMTSSVLDWKILRSRLEIRWNQQFPELRIPLTM